MAFGRCRASQVNTNMRVILRREWGQQVPFRASISDRGKETSRGCCLPCRVAGGGGIEPVRVLRARRRGGSILGRFNLRDTDKGVAVLGYRVAQNVAGHRLATATVDQLCCEAGTSLELCSVRPARFKGNICSQRVLLKAGFVLLGPADRADLGGKPGSSCGRLIALPRSQ